MLLELLSGLKRVEQLYLVVISLHQKLFVNYKKASYYLSSTQCEVFVDSTHHNSPNSTTHF